MTEPTQGPSSEPAAESSSGPVGGSTSGTSRGTRERERVSPLTFYRQVVAELRKVVWPTQQQLVTYFIVVLVFVLVMIAYVSAIDLGFGKAIFAVFGGETTKS